MVANLMFDLDAVNISTDAPIRGAGCGSASSSPPSDCSLVILGVVRAGDVRVVRVRGRRLHRRRVLVHLVHQLRQPRGHHRPHPQRHVRRHRAGERSRRSSSCSSPADSPLSRLGRYWIPTVPPTDLVVPHDDIPTRSSHERTRHTRPRRHTRSCSSSASHNAGRSPDGTRLVQSPRRRPRHRLVRRLRTRHRTQPRRRSRPWPKSASTSPPSTRSRGPTRSSAPPTSSSPWAAATAARYYPGTRYEDWELDDPAGLDIDAVRPIRDEIQQRVRELLDQITAPSG